MAGRATLHNPMLPGRRYKESSTRRGWPSRREQINIEQITCSSTVRLLYRSDGHRHSWHGQQWIYVCIFMDMPYIRVSGRLLQRTPFAARCRKQYRFDTCRAHDFFVNIQRSPIIAFPLQCLSPSLPFFHKLTAFEVASKRSRAGVDVSHGSSVN